MKKGKGNALKVFVFIMCTFFALAFGVSIALEALMVNFNVYSVDANKVYFEVLDPFYGGMNQSFLSAEAAVGGRFHFLWVLILALYEIKYWIYLITFVALVMAIINFVWLMKLSGRRPGIEEVCPGALNKVPTDIMVLIDLLLICIPWIAYEEYAYGMGFNDIVLVCIITVILLFCFCIFLGFSMDMAARIKAKTLFKNTVINKLLKYLWKALKWCFGKLKVVGSFIGEIYKNLPMIWRTVLILCALTIIDGLAIACSWYEMDSYAVFFIIRTLILVPAVMFMSVTLRKLQAQGEELAKGNLSYHVDTKGLFWDFKKHADSLNNIAKGMTIAVNDRLKSERMKTELITNVSHDIKTPLTSIINYTNLIAGEETDNENIKEYTEVLSRQSQRLKHLIDDLVEASKASTGNLDVNLEPCEASVFITQIAGEYEEKIQNAGLTVVCKVPEEDITIMADGRRMLRVFDNLLNNICKYSLEGSRVYLSLTKEDEKAVFSFKNTSRAELNISEEELMERFTRGDSSRNTEGNGLGLSIAKSITELQNGKFNLTVDGDLFKVELEFPIVK